jgi:hypothetical protein
MGMAHGIHERRGKGNGFFAPCSEAILNPSEKIIQKVVTPFRRIAIPTVKAVTRTKK